MLCHKEKVKKKEKEPVKQKSVFSGTLCEKKEDPYSPNLKKKKIKVAKSRIPTDAQSVSG